MAILWVEHDSLSKKTRETTCKECEVSGDVTLLNCMRHFKTWIEILDTYIEVREGELGDLDPQIKRLGYISCSSATIPSRFTPN